MKTRLLIVILCGALTTISFNLFSKDVYTSPKLKLDKKLGQTVLIKDTEWESNYKIEDNTERDIASLKKNPPKYTPKKMIKRAPSSDKHEPIKYWIVHPKYE